MGISLNPELEERIAAKVRSGRYPSVDEVVREGLDLLEARDSAEPVSPSGGNAPAWKRVVQLGNEIPEDELLKIPTDFSRNLEHYLYGSPKEEE